MIPSTFPLTLLKQWVLTLLSFFIVAFGQPAWLPINGLFASILGFALFWRVLLAYPQTKQRFILGSIWFFAVQLVQLSWFSSHPFWYIYAVYLLIAIGMGIQFGIVAIFINPQLFVQKKPMQTLMGFLPIAALWTLFEWIRLFLLSGTSWNPIGIAMTGNLYALQAASLGGVFLLSFWVMLVNLLALWAFVQRRIVFVGVWIAVAVMPYIYGIAHLTYHEKNVAVPPTNFKALLVQTAFAPEEIQVYTERKGMLKHVIEEWRTILEVTKKNHGNTIDLIVLPEFVVPFGTYGDVYPLLDVKRSFYEVFGPESLVSLPSLEYPFFSIQKTVKGPQILVNNAFWTQALANYFQADVLIGLEDAEDVPHGTREYYSAAIFIQPQKKWVSGNFSAERYAKRVLVPMGEYIPFETCRKLAQSYGVFGSFTCGKEALTMNSNGVSFSPSICYEETYGNLIREGRQKGADLFVNLTSDVWFPNSKLPHQHLDHARLRTVENGVPLIRACNTGITIAIDSLGRDIAVLGGKTPEKVEWIADSLLVNVPIYSYRTLYSSFGDKFIAGISFCLLLLFFRKNRVL